MIKRGERILSIIWHWKWLVIEIMSKSLLSAMKAKYKSLNRDADPSPERVVETKSSRFRSNVEAMM
jgi:hypothetical protein